MKNPYIFLFLVITQSAFSQKTAHDYFNLGEKCSYEFDSSTTKAISYYSKAIELDSTCSECYVKRAWRKHHKDPEGAISDYQKALEFDPACFKCYNGIADYFCKERKNYNMARQNYYFALKVLKCKTDQDYLEQSGIIQNIGITFFLELGENNIGFKKDRQVRLGIWDSLITTDPQTRYYEERGNLRSDDFIDDYKGALEDYMVVYERYKKNNSDSELLGTYSNLLWSIATCNKELENCFQSIQYYNKVIELKHQEKTTLLQKNFVRYTITEQIVK